MNLWTQMLGNQLLMSAVTGWVVAQALKTAIDCALNKSFNAERLVGSYYSSYIKIRHRIL